MLPGACRKVQSPEHWSAAELVEKLQILEQGSENAEGTEAGQLLLDFAHRAVHARVEVAGAAVASVYERGADWLTRPYFAVTYDRESYVYLEDLDPGFQADLAHHRYWASVAHTMGERQLMFELALDHSDWKSLRVQCPVDLTCELAAVIRGGKSVYCRALETRLLDCDNHLPEAS
jgi:hypothetical protein